MTERKQVCVSMSDEIIEMLKAVEKDTGLKRSVVIQELIRKAYTDEITRKIITNENYKRIVAKKMDGSSHNVHCVNQKENASPEPYPEEAGCPAKGTFSSIEQCIEIAKAKWVLDDDEEYKNWWE